MKRPNFLAYLLSTLAIIGGVTFAGGHHPRSITDRSTFNVDAGADSGLLVRSGFSGLAPTASQTWVFNIADQRLYAWDGTNWQQQTVGRIQSAGVGAPSSSNDITQGYKTGSLWYDSVGQQWYICQANTAASAVWNIFTGRVSQVDVNTSIQPKFTMADAMADFVASGLLGSPVASLTMTTPSGVAYVSGYRVAPTSSSFAYTASKDTYDYLQTNGTINHVPVANGAGAPVGPTGLPIQKVVTNGSAVTSVVGLAATAPTLNVGLATSAQHAIGLAQADGRYAMGTALTGPFSANLGMMTPNGSTGALSPRAIVNADLPVISIAKGGLGASATPTAFTVLTGNGTNWTTSAAPSGALQYLRTNAGNTALEWAASAGISSITFADSQSLLTFSPNPITSNGTETITWANVIANAFIGGPTSGAAAAPSARLLVPADCPVNVVQLRLYCVSGSPLSDSSGSSATLYVGGIPQGNQVLFQQTGGNYVLLALPETAVTMSGLTASTNYDVYVKDLLGTVTVSLTAWTGDTTPPTRSTDSLNRSTKSGDTTSLLVGGFRAVDATHTQCDQSKRWVSNVYNQIRGSLFAVPASDIWNVTSLTWANENGSAVDGVGRYSVFSVIAGNLLEAKYVQSNQTGNHLGNIGMALDVSAGSPDVWTFNKNGNNVTDGKCNTLINNYKLTPGYHFLQKLEASDAMTVYKGNNATGAEGATPYSSTSQFGTYASGVLNF